MTKEELSKLDFSGLDLKSLQEWIDLWEKKTEKFDVRHRFLQFCSEKDYDAMQPISGTEFLTLLEEFEA